jgi:hypothetical protein
LVILKLHIQQLQIVMVEKDPLLESIEIILQIMLQHQLLKDEYVYLKLKVGL